MLRSRSVRLVSVITEVIATVIHRQILVVAPQVAEGFVERRLALFALTLAVVVVGRILVVVGLGVLLVVGRAGAGLQRRVVVHLGVDTFQQLVDGKLYQLSLKQLLHGEALRLLLLLSLFLYLRLAHLKYSFSCPAKAASSSVSPLP